VDVPAPPQKKPIGSAQFTRQKRGKIGEIQQRQAVVFVDDIQLAVVRLESEGQGVPATILPTPA